jgi:anthranilate phosphoribosyltransferase
LFYKWYQKYLENGYDGLETFKRTSKRQWNSIPEEQKDLWGGNTIDEAATVFMNVLENKATEAQKNAVIANAAYAIRTFDTKRPIETCVALARETVESGRARATFRKFIELNS